MVNVAQAWAEEYHQREPDISVQVLGGGSGVGIASLIDGNCDMANSSRLMKGEELEKTQARRGSPAVAHTVGFDAMGIYVHPSNPDQADFVGRTGWRFLVENPTITRWSELGITMPPGVPDRIIRVSRQNSSGTYAYFREHVLGKGKDMGLGSLDANGSKDAVALGFPHALCDWLQWDGLCDTGSEDGARCRREWVSRVSPRQWRMPRTAPIRSRVLC